MRTRIIFFSAAALILAAMLSLSVVYAEEEASPSQPERRSAPTEGRMQRPDRRSGERGGVERMQQMMLEGLRRQIEVNDDEWKVLEPRISKVMELSMKTRFSGFRGMMGGRDRDPQAESGELTGLQKATNELQETIKDQEATSDVVKEKLLALRKEKEKSQQELAKARAELLSVLSVRQEAALVLMGVLE